MLRRSFFNLLGISFLTGFWLFAADQTNADIGLLDTLPSEVEIKTPTAVTGAALSALKMAQPGTDINASNIAGNESEVSIDVNPTNPLNQVIVGHAPSTSFATMNTFFTMDGGQTWTLVALGDAEDGITSTFRFDPTVAFDDDGNVYAAYGVRTNIPDDSGRQRTVVVCKSTDGGQTYPQCTQLSTTADIGNLPGNDKWHLATGPDPLVPGQQNVYIAWTQNITEASGTDQRIVVSGSTDGGASFSTPLIINDPSISSTDSSNLFADPAVGPNGELYVVWHDIDAGQIFVDISTDGGATFGTDIFITSSSTGFKSSVPAQPDRGIHVGPTLDVDRSGGTFNGRLYLTYTDAPNTLPDVDIFVRSSNDGGVNWSSATKVNDDVGSTSQFLPWLDVDQQTGMISVVWYDARNDSNNKKVEIFIALSDDGAASFEPNILVSDGQSDQSTDNSSRTINNYLEYIGIASFDCQVFPVWADNSTDLSDLDYFTDQVKITGLETPLCNQPPICDANGPYTAECALNTTQLDGSGSFDPENAPLIYTWTGPFIPSPATGATPTVMFPPPLGDKVVTLEVDDSSEAPQQCNATVQVIDTLPPVITCNNPGSITPPDAPISFAATASDQCQGPKVPEITGYDCFTFTKKGKRIDKTQSCMVSFTGDTLTIQDSGGVGDTIEWTVVAVDESGNMTTEVCTLAIVNP